jgi:LPXTG-site transpeptidase (sortase) family protein
MNRRLTLLLVLVILVFTSGCTTSFVAVPEQEIAVVKANVEIVESIPEVIPTPSSNEFHGYVTLWFDDGLLSTYQVAYPELEKRGWKAVLGVISDRDDAQEKFTPDGDPVMSWNQVTDLYQAGWEISSHSRTHPYMDSVTDEYTLKGEIIGSRNDLVQKGYSVQSFTLPYGENGLDFGQSLIDQNYSYWRSLKEDINPIPASRHITTIPLRANTNREYFEDLVKQTKESGGWLVITVHAIVEKPVHSWQHTPEQFKMLLEVIENSNLKVVLPNSMFDTFGYAEGNISQVSTEYNTLYDEIEQEDFGKGVSLEIPSLGINTALESVCHDDQYTYDFSKLHEAPIWICTDASENLVNIGAPGASIILGHRQWGIAPKVFAKLDRLVEGDSVSVSTEGKAFDYQVKETSVIDPENLWQTISVYNTEGVQSEKSYLILVTCTPYGTDWQRMLVILERNG